MPKPVVVMALTAGRKIPGARFRVGQYVAPLREENINLRWWPAPIAKHPPRSHALRPLWLPLSVIGRIPAVAATYKADVTLTSRELVSTMVTWEPMLKKPYVLDVDDAIWLHRGGRFAKRLGKIADVVVAGNSYVADWFSQYCDQIEIIPTAVDTDRFIPNQNQNDRHPVIGWSGTYSNLPFLEALQPAIRRVFEARPDVKLRISSDRHPKLNDLPSDRVEYEPWSVQGEVAFINSLDIGLMPLADNAWSQGKCSYKMLLYLSCQVAVVVSPIGMNSEVLEARDVGRGATSEDSWVDALIELIDDAELRKQMGKRGRDLITSSYSIKALTPKLASVFRKAAGR
ncbi:MAG: glycosyltransferase family 4 protein [Bacteroidales bacterium]|nr:glycosyltransferase family 4 protein [Candidatus Latescibacterota bacterium]